jgi:hypothetical protein
MSIANLTATDQRRCGAERERQTTAEGRPPVDVVTVLSIVGGGVANDGGKGKGG